MQFCFGNPQDIYRSLKYPIVSLPELRLLGHLNQEGIQKVEGIESLIDGGAKLSVITESVQLYPPVGLVQAVFIRRGNKYSSNMMIHVSNPNSLIGYSNFLEKHLDKKYNWRSLNKNGEGFCVSGEGKVHFAVNHANPSNEIRVISAGSNGAVPLEFGDENDFVTDLEKLSTLSNF